MPLYEHPPHQLEQLSATIMQSIHRSVPFPVAIQSFENSVKLRRPGRFRWLAGICLCLFALKGWSESELLPKPDEIKPDVEFWKRVYTEINTDQGFIHDDRHLDIVYGTVNLEPGIDRRERNRQVRKIKERYKSTLLKLARESHDDLSNEERRILELWPDDVTRKQLRTAARHLRFQLGQSDKFKAGLERSGRWMEHIKAVLERMEVPPELAALPHVESSFNPNAYSFVGAAGMWQFTRSTGRRFMRVDHVVDERLDPFISTEAAAELLKHNYASTQSWPLAITAYNHGAAGMRRAIEETGGTDIARILREYRGRRFKFASRNFYVAFLAAVEVNKNAEQYFGDIDFEPPDRSRTVEVPAYIPARVLADSLDVDFDRLKRLNPALRPPVWEGDKRVPKGYTLRVPGMSPSEAGAMIARIDPQYRFSRQAADVTYRVRRGDALSTIADRYNVSQAELMRMNNLRSRHFIREGQVLRLPQTEGVTSVERDLVDGTYRVQQGDTLSVVADAFGVSRSRLMEQNDLDDPDHLVVGQVLNVAAAEPAAEPTSEEAAADASEAAADEAQQVAAAKPPPVEEPEITAELKPVEPPAEAAEDAEQFVAEDTESVGPPGAHPALSADPSDYSVDENRSIQIQAAETLGHYAEWLELRAADLRRINGLAFGEPLIIGDRLKLDLSKVDAETFESRRVAYHRNLQEAYFSQYQIAGVEERTIRRGESIWELTHFKYEVPLWLFMQYNPDIDLNRIKPGSSILLPKVRPKSS
jgi:membrane-bound lytic murein transglycosylase D